MADIFLSYNRDDLATAKRFAEGLEAEGFSVWWDVDLRSGEHYDKVTEQALKAVKLVDAADGAQIWAHRFEDTLEDVFALQDKVALSAAGIIEPAVRRAETGRARARPTADMSSYELYLRGCR